METEIKNPQQKVVQRQVQTSTNPVKEEPKGELQKINSVKEPVPQDGSITEKEAQRKFLELVKNQDNSGKSLAEQGREILNISSMANLVTNEDFVQQYQEEQKKQIIKDLKEQGKLDAIKKSAEKQTNRNLRNDAFYNAFKPFFENFMGIKVAFGLIPMIITVLIFYAPYLVLSLVMTVLKFTFKGINEVFSAILEFKKPAKALCLTVLWTSIAIAIILALIYGAQALFGFKLI